MAAKSIVKKLLIFTSIVAILLNVYIYTYPSLNSKNCSWYRKDGLYDTDYLGDLVYTYMFDQFKHHDDEKEIPDIKLLAVGDPQINGNWPKTPYIKRLDNFGNDYYLGHIYKLIKNRLQPTHVSVMGDQFSSQWISDSEFFNRTRRYLTRIFLQPENHTKEIFDVINKHEDLDWNTFIDSIKSKSMDEAFDYGYEDVYDWTSRDVKEYNGEPLFINITGNHDVGYSGDATWQHMTRFIRLFGKDSYWIEYNKNTDHAYRIVVLNDLFLEGPALQPEFLSYTWHFLEKLQQQNFKGSTILLTHIPFYKKDGLCADDERFIFYDEKSSQREPYKKGLLRAQNHLSREVTQKVMDTIFDTEYPGIILTGHDHVGCKTVYNKNPFTGEWEASAEEPSKMKRNNYVREIVVRSMMGDYDGHMGLMTGHFDEIKNQWKFEYSSCPFVVQHVWWATKVFTILSFFFTSLLFIL